MPADAVTIETIAAVTLLAWAACYLTGRRRQGWPLLAASYGLLLISSFLTGDTIGEFLFTACLAVILWAWWRDRDGKDRRRTLRAYGEKSWRRLARLVSRMPRRQAGRRLNPQPQGA